MEELLAKQKEALQDAAALIYIRDSDFYITPHINYIPKAIRFPCVGIKDGDISRSENASGMWEVTMKARLVVYVQMQKPEASIMGDSSISKKGVLAIEKDVLSVLDENLLDIAGMQSAVCLSSSESEMFGDENDTLQRKILNFEYIKEELRASAT